MTLAALPLALLLASPLPDPPAPVADDDDGRVEELERKVDILAEEIERLRQGEAAPVSESFSGLGAAASKIYSAAGGLSIGGYGEALYQNFRGGSSDEADFLRAVLYFGYKFDDHWVFNAEIEVEHTDEIGLEFATIDYLHRPALNARAGLVLVPMGFVNELHEPNTYWSARRPDVESFILPSTWRENGVGVFGDVCDFSYRAYVLNGFDGTGFRSSNGLRGGRQKGGQAEADDLAGVVRLDWAGVPGVTLGGSYYFGHSGQATGVDGDVSIHEAHVEARFEGFRFRGLYAHATVDDVLGLAQGAGLLDNMGMLAAGVTGDEAIGEELHGGYLELGYDVLTLTDSKQSLVPFIRYETYDLQDDVPAPFFATGSRDVEVTTFGLAWLPIPNLVFKLDFQDYDTDAADGIDQLNLAAGYVF